MLSNSWPPFNAWWQLIMFMLIISKKSLMVQTDTDRSSKMDLSITKYMNKDLPHIKHNGLEDLKIWSILPRQLWYSDDDYDDENINSDRRSFENNIKKRTWRSLQGSWGKRSERQYVKADDNNRFIEDDMANTANNDSQLNYLKDYLIKNANIFNSISDQILNDEYNTDTLTISNENDNTMAEKRAWNKLKHVWGKRDKKNSSWNNFRNAWGKRESNNWNNLKGLWGKRNTDTI